MNATVRMSMLPEKHRRFCQGGPCACAGCANHTVTKDEFDEWEKAGRPTVKFKLAFSMRETAPLRLAAIELVKSGMASSIQDAVRLIHAGKWPTEATYDEFLNLRYESDWSAHFNFNLIQN